MISDLRKDVHIQFEQRRKEIAPLFSNEIFSLGPKIIKEYDFELPKLTEDLDDDSLLKYIKLLESDDQKFAEMFKKLMSWINDLPKPPESINKN